MCTHNIHKGPPYTIDMEDRIGALYMLNTCPFTWEVRALLDHLNLPHERIQINPMKIKKSVAFAGDWGKTPVWKMEDGEVVVDSTPIMIRIDEKYNAGNLWKSPDNNRRDKWMELLNLLRQIKRKLLSYLLVLRRVDGVGVGTGVTTRP